MGLTRQYVRYSANGVCNLVGSTNGAVVAVDGWTCAVLAGANVNMYNMRTMDKVREIATESTHALTCLRLSANRRFLATGDAAGIVRLYDQHETTEARSVTFSGHKTGVNCLAFKHDGLVLASGGKDSVIILWDVVGECGLFRLMGHTASITHLAFTADDQHLLSSCKDTLIKFWHLATHNCYYTIADNRSEVYSFSLLNDDRLLLVASAELELKVFELIWRATIDESRDESHVGNKRRELTNPESSDCLADQANPYMRCVRKGNLLRSGKGRALQLSISTDEKICCCIEEARTRMEKKLRKAKRKYASEMQDVPEDLETSVRKDLSSNISRIGDFQASAKVKWIDFVDAIRACDKEDELEYRMFALLACNTVHCVSLRVNLKSGATECTVLSTLDCFGHRSDIRSVALFEDGFSFVTGAMESAAVWNRDSLRRVALLETEGMTDICAVLVVPGDKHCLVGTKSGKVFLFDLTTNDLIDTVTTAHNGAIWSLLSTFDKVRSEKGFISASADKTVKCWVYELTSIADRRQLCVRERRVLELTDEALCCCLGGERFLAVGLLDNTARVFFADTLKFFLTLYGHSLPVTCIDISDDNELVVTGSADKSVKIWGLDFGDCHRSLFAHDDSVTCVKFAAKSRLFWSTGRDGRVVQWDGDHFERVQTLNGHHAEIWAMAITSNARFVITASHDKSVRLWEKTDEAIVLEEEREMEREEEYEKTMEDERDVPGEQSGEADLAPKKTMASIRGTESIIEAVEIVRNQRANEIDNEKGAHPLMTQLGSRSLDHFLLDIVHNLRSSDLEQSLLLVPYGFVPDLLLALTACVAVQYKVEFASRVLLFLVKLHHNHMINSVETLAVIDRLRTIVPTGLATLKDVCGFNLATLRFLQMEIEERDSIRFFQDVSAIENKKRGKHKKGARDRALLNDVK